MVIESEKQVKLAEAAQKLGVDLILLFGSRADGSNRPDSDFDIAYRSQKALADEAYHDLSRALREYIGSDNLHTLDLHDARALTLYEVMRKAKVLYAEHMRDFYQLRAGAFRRYEDEAKPLYEIIFNRLKREYNIT